MPELSLSSDYVARLIVKMRGVQGRETLTDPQSGSNAPDDDEIDALPDTPGEQTELVALLWTGRGDAEPEDWSATIVLAGNRHETPTAHYLMSEPLVADFWADGLEKLGVGVPMGNDASP